MIGTLLLTSAALLGGAAAPRPPAGGLPPLVYIANQAAAKITVVDATADSVVATVDLQAMGFSDHAKPHHIAVAPDGRFWYVSLIGDNVVLKLDRANHVVGRATMEIPGLLALDRTGQHLYVTHTMSAVRAPSRIGVIKTADMSIEEVEVLIPRPHAIAVGRDGKHVYIGSLGTNQVAVYDVAKDQVDVVDIPGEANRVIVQFALSPDGKTLAATAQLTGEILALSLKDPGHPALDKVAKVGDWPWHPAYSPDGKEIWVPNQRSNDVSVVDARSWQVTHTITGEGFAQPHGLAFTPNGRAFVSAHNSGQTMDMGGVGMAHGVTDRPGYVVSVSTKGYQVLRTMETAPDGAGMGAAAP